MKKLFRNLMAVCLAIVAVSSLTSCLKDDSNENTITPEERSKIFNAAMGIHDGTLYPVYNGNDGYLYKVSDDSVKNMTFEILPDTTIQVEEIPDSIYANLLDKSKTEQNKIVEALKKTNTVQNLSAKIYFLGYYDSNKSVYYYTTYATDRNIGLEIDGKTHTLTVNSYISVYYNPSTRQCQATITPQIIKYDNSTTYSPNGVYLAIVKTK